MSMFQRDPRAGVFLGGDRVSGQDIRDQNGELYLESYELIPNLLYSSSRCTIYREYREKFTRPSRSGQDARR